MRILSQEDLAELKKRLGACRKVKGKKEYYDCPKCTEKGYLAVTWSTDDFVCNHRNTCGLAGRLSTLAYEVGIRTHKSDNKPFKMQNKPTSKPMPKLGSIPKAELISLSDAKSTLSPMEQRKKYFELLGYAPGQEIYGTVPGKYGTLKSQASCKVSDLIEKSGFSHVRFSWSLDTTKDFRYLLVESDKENSHSEQYEFMQKTKLPVKSIVYTGNTSLHFLVDTGAKNAKEREQRVKKIYEFLKVNNFDLDESCKDASRYTRLPGVASHQELKKVDGQDKIINYKQSLLIDNFPCSKTFEDWEHHLSNLIKRENVLSAKDIKMQSVQSGFSSGFATHDYNDSGVKPGNLTLLTGKRNQGKTTFSRQVVLSAAQQSVKTFLLYGEGSLGYEKGYLVRLTARKDEIIGEDNGYGRKTFRACDSVEKRFDNFYSPYIEFYSLKEKKSKTLFDDLFYKMKLSAQDGTKLFVIDNMMILTADQPDTFKAQKKIISDLKTFAVKYEAHIILIAHPKKGEGDQSISGALEQENTADTILRFKRVYEPSKLKVPSEFEQAEKNKITAMVTNEKVRDGGTGHNMYLEFDPKTQSNKEIIYLEDLKHLMGNYEGMYSRLPQVCEDRGGVNINGIENNPLPSVADEDYF